MRTTGKRWLTVLLVLLLTAAASQVWAQKEVQDHPVIKPLPDVIEKEGEYKRFDAHKFRVQKEGGYEKKEVRGEYWEFEYRTKPEISGLEILENYKRAALEKNGKILYESQKEVVFTLPSPEGGTLWVEVNTHGWDARYTIDIIKEKPLKKTLTFGAAQMKKELETKGSVAVYGINFDFDKATLKPGSEKVLLEIVKLLKSSPDLKVEVQGHTDNVGGKDYNLKLSQARAETVKAFLVLHGIEASRLTPKGYGLDRPVASNDTEEGRAKNRRVELKKL
jgi:outer membrane protein OmpA-like peptidoglycan-associated protein